ncbi:MAG: Crp/Fnr family transcriptional regulator [Acidimicrobiales bacterium]
MSAATACKVCPSSGPGIGAKVPSGRPNVRIRPAHARPGCRQELHLRHDRRRFRRSDWSTRATVRSVRRWAIVYGEVFHEGEHPDHVLVILSGHLKLSRLSTDGKELLIEIREAGELVGELGAIDREPRSATATAVGPLEAIVIPAGRFEELLTQRAKVSLAVLRLVTSRLRQSTGRRLEAGIGDAFARLCGRLVELAERHETGADGTIEIHSSLTQQELADWIGAARDAVVMALHRLRELGWVETGRRRNRILDIEAMRGEAIT